MLLKTSQIPLFLDVGLKNTVNYGVFGHLTFKNLAICSGFCLPGHKNLVKNGMFVFFSCFCCCCCCCCCCRCCCCCSCSCFCSCVSSSFFSSSSSSPSSSSPSSSSSSSSCSCSCSCSCCCCCCCCCRCCCCYCRTSKNHVGAGGPSRSAAWIWFSTINHPVRGTPHFWKPIVEYHYILHKP